MIICYIPRWRLNMKWLIKLNEMSYDRQKVKDSIDDHVQQIVENWLLLEAVKLAPEQFSEPTYHWLEELCAQIEPGIRKLDAVNYKQRAIDKLVDEVLISDARLDDPILIYNIVHRKLKNEHIPETMIEPLIKRWIQIGLPEISNVFKHDKSSVSYEERKDAELKAIQKNPN